MIRLTTTILAEATTELGREIGVEPAQKALHAFCSQRNRAHLLPGTLRRLSHNAKKQAEKNTLHITLAREPHGDTVSHIAKHVGASKDTLSQVHIDSSIVGGFEARHGGKVYDARISNLINQISI